MKHLGDITKINGAEIAPVDVCTFGAPCQDLSVAGKRQGMSSELMGDEETTRSGLFFDAIRLIKEMRKHYAEEQLERRTRSDKSVGDDWRYDRPWVCPRFTVYENVPGALSSNNGYDWQAVLTESIRVIDEEAPPIPVPEKGWPKQGVVCGDGWSLAWAEHNAQDFGVPQRRRRLSLLCDYGGLSALEILSDIHPAIGCRPEVSAVGESLSGDTEQGEEEGQATAGDSGESPFATG